VSDRFEVFLFLRFEQWFMRSKGKPLRGWCRLFWDRSGFAVRLPSLEVPLFSF